MSTRRNFLKGLAALALAPLAAPAGCLDRCKATALPAKAAPAATVVERSITQYDNKVKLGPFTKRVTSLAKQAMRRMEKASAEATAAAEELRTALTDLYISPEAMEYIRKWGVDQIDETKGCDFHAEPAALNDVRWLGRGDCQPQLWNFVLAPSSPTRPEGRNP